MNNNPRISIILPTFNEAGNIALLIEKILAFVSTPLEILVVDDDSPDRTWEIAGAFAENDNRVRVIRRTGQRGLTSAISEGIEQATGEYVAWMDCDFSHPPDMLPEMIGLLDEGYDFVVASRYVKGGADRRDETLHRILSRLITSLARVTLFSRFKDYTSGYIIAKKEMFDHVTLTGDYGEYFISLVYQALHKGYRSKEIPFVNLSRQIGQSKTATSPMGFCIRGYKYLLKVFALATGLSKQ